MGRKAHTPLGRECPGIEQIDICLKCGMISLLGQDLKELVRVKSDRGVRVAGYQTTVDKSQKSDTMRE